MKIIVINGSYRKDGMTKVLIDLPVEFCRGCNTCAKGREKSIGTCPINDPVADILQKMVDCDRVVFATPVYCHAPTAVMKRFIERCVPLFRAGRMGPVPRNRSRKEKKGLVIISSGAPYPFNVLMGMTGYGTKILKRFCKACGCEKTFFIKAGGMEANEKWRSKWAYAAYLHGTKIAAKI